MPVHLQAISRRRFLQTAALAGVTVLTWNRALADAGVDPHFMALLSDTHVPNDPSVATRGVNMSANLQQAVKQVLAQDRRPAGVVINGDCAYLRGLSEDYRNLGGLLEPLREAEVPVHLTMGNHDHRERLYEQIQSQRPKDVLVDGQHITVLRTPRANWFLLDSLFQTNVVTGEIGEAQLRWLDQTLQTMRDKPAIVMAHHDPQWEQTSETVVGIRDTQACFDILARHRHVKAYLYGHRHRWERSEHKGIHLVNLPACAYVFQNDQPNGWVAAHVEDAGMTLTLQAHDPNHPKHGEQVKLAWR